MKYYIDENNQLFAYEDDGSQDYLIGDKTQITEADALAIANPPPTQEQIVASNTLTRQKLVNIALANIGIIQCSAAVANPRDGDADNLLALQQYIDELRNVDLTRSPLQLPATPVALPVK